MVKARRWIERSESRDDPMDRFRDLWTAFNNVYGEIRGSERQKIRRYLARNIDEATAIMILGLCGKNVAGLIAKPVVDMRRNGRDTGHHIVAYREAKLSLDSLTEVLMIAYQIRCNLVHGQKSPDRARDTELCYHASEILHAMLVGATE